MPSMRKLTFVATLAVATLAVVFLTGLGGASAQYYEPGYAPGYPQQGRYNRVIVTHDAVPNHYRARDARRAYPYVGPSVAPLPYQPVPGYRYRRTKGHAGRVVAPSHRAIYRSARTVRSKRVAPRHVAAPQRRASGKVSRVIRAEAEVRIIGNDQMSIRLFRKRPHTR